MSDSPVNGGRNSDSWKDGAINQDIRDRDLELELGLVLQYVSRLALVFISM
jgi:hypothetical protein